MTMPIDLVLVRHGQSEGNLANKRSREGDHSAFSDEFLERHSSTWRLTDLGREQAKIAGIWIKENISSYFDRCYVSEYIRALETAANLDLENALWYRDFYLRERDWGQLDVMSVEERKKKFGDELKRRERDGMYWAPPGGESMVRQSLRIDRNISTLHRECQDKKVVTVCHGETMWTFRIKIERMTSTQYRELDESTDAFDRIHNCQIMHYTRRDPETGFLHPRLEFMRSICPWNLSLSSNEWRRITRKQFTNEELLEEVNKIPIMVNEVIK